MNYEKFLFHYGIRKLFKFYKNLLLLSSSSAAIRTTVGIFLKATKDKSQNRICLRQQRFLKNDKSDSFLDFHLVYKYVGLKNMR